MKDDYLKGRLDGRNSLCNEIAEGLKIRGFHCTYLKSHIHADIIGDIFSAVENPSTPSAPADNSTKGAMSLLSEYYEFYQTSSGKYYQNNIVEWLAKVRKYVEENKNV